MFELNLCGTKGRSNKQEGSITYALSITTGQLVVTDSDLGCGNFIVQPSFGYDFYGGRDNNGG